MSKEKNKTIIFLAFLVLLLGGVWAYYHKGELNVDFWFTLVASLASIAGIVYTLVQVSHMQSIAYATQEAVEKNNDIFNRLMSLAKVVEAQSIAENMKAYLRLKNYEITSVKMEEFIKLLIMIKAYIENDDDYKKPFDDLKRHIPMISSDNKNVNRQVLEKDTSFDVIQLINDLDDVKTTLAEINAKYSRANSNR